MYLFTPPPKKKERKRKKIHRYTYIQLILFNKTRTGIGGGINITCCFHMIAKYFKKRLGIANSIMMTGGSVGIILLPQLASRLQEYYPFTWATLITGGCRTAEYLNTLYVYFEQAYLFTWLCVYV